MWKEKIIQLHGQSTHIKYLDNEMGMSIVISNPYFWLYSVTREWNSIIQCLEKNIPIRRMLNSMLKDIVVICDLDGVPHIGVKN